MGAKRKPVDQQLYDNVRELVKSRVTVWPSAYASGQLVKEYKRQFAELYGSNEDPYTTPKPKLSEASTFSEDDVPLQRWFDEEWVNVCEKTADGRYKPCGKAIANLDQDQYPYCRPLYRISSHTPRSVNEFTAAELEQMCQYKRSLPQGIQGKPTRVRFSKVLK